MTITTEMQIAIRNRAAANAVHHGGSAAGLRLAATALLRPKTDTQ